MSSEHLTIVGYDKESGKICLLSFFVTNDTTLYYYLGLVLITVSVQYKVIQTYQVDTNS